MILATCVATKSLNMITCDINGVITLVHCVRAITPAVNDVVLIDRVGSQWWAYGITGPTTPAPITPGGSPPAPVVQRGTLLVTPVETRSYRTTYAVGWRTDDADVYHGQYGGYGNHQGCVFYGDKPRSLAGATVESATMRLRVLQIGAYPPASTTLRLMTNAARPGGAPTLQAASTTVAGITQGTTVDSVAVPTAWAQALVDGSAGGICFFSSGGSPYVRYAGRGSWGPAFTLSINWRR